MKGRANPVANLIVLATAFLAFGGWLAAGAVAALPIAVIGFYVSLSPRMLKEWERGVLLRLGRFERVLGPGINWTFPGFDRLVSTVDIPAQPHCAADSRDEHELRVDQGARRADGRAQ